MSSKTKKQAVKAFCQIKTEELHRNKGPLPEQELVNNLIPFG